MAQHQQHILNSNIMQNNIDQNIVHNKKDHNIDNIHDITHSSSYINYKERKMLEKFKFEEKTLRPRNSRISFNEQELKHGNNLSNNLSNNLNTTSINNTADIDNKLTGKKRGRKRSKNSRLLYEKKMNKKSCNQNSSKGKAKYNGINNSLNTNSNVNNPNNNGIENPNNNNNNANLDVSKFKYIDYDEISRDEYYNEEEDNIIDGNNDDSILNPKYKSMISCSTNMNSNYYINKNINNKLKDISPFNNSNFNTNNSNSETIQYNQNQDNQNRNTQNNQDNQYKTIDFIIDSIKNKGYKLEYEKYMKITIDNNNTNTNNNTVNKITETNNSETHKTENPTTKNYNNITNYSNTLNSNTFINCDLRFFNFSLLTSRIGSFDIIIADPPWRIKGAQRNDSSFMFSNSKFNLDYNTLSNHEILSIPVEKLSNSGFFFLWVLNSLLDVGYACLNKWGYEVVDQITWIKTRNSNRVYVSQGYYFLHSSEVCLVGFKNNNSSLDPNNTTNTSNNTINYKSKIATNIIFSDVRSKSQKPEEIYELVDKLMPGAKKLELFARNHNLRKGWFSLGNQLGENYNKWKNLISCDECEQEISIGLKRYKSKLLANYDICEKCYNENYVSMSKDSSKEKESCREDDNGNLDELISIDLYEKNNTSKNSNNQINNDVNDNSNTNNKQSNYNKIRIILNNDLNTEETANNNSNKNFYNPPNNSLNNIHNNNTTYNPNHTNTNTTNITFSKLKQHSNSISSFFKLNNNIDEDILHNYFQCNLCNTEPIWGVRFHCSICQEYDLCEACFDRFLMKKNREETVGKIKETTEEKFEKAEIEEKLEKNEKHIHEFCSIELPPLANGLDVQSDLKCKICYQKPIVGPCFRCTDCKNYSICQNCYFNSNYVDEKHLNGNSDEHKMIIITNSKESLAKYVKW